jgi:hypothetical protein
VVVRHSALDLSEANFLSAARGATRLSGQMPVLDDHIIAHVTHVYYPAHHS